MVFLFDLLAWKLLAQLGMGILADSCRLVAMKYPVLKAYNASDVDAIIRDASSAGSRRRGDQAKGKLQQSRFPYRITKIGCAVTSRSLPSVSELWKARDHSKVQKSHMRT